MYNKLVRDKIPEIIAKNNETPITRILQNEEYIKVLNIKRRVEWIFRKRGAIEELADLEEVLRAILDFKNVSYEIFEKIRNEKVEKRGAFKKRFF